jgi:hypothetical protein
MLRRISKATLIAMVVLAAGTNCERQQDTQSVPAVAKSPTPFRVLRTGYEDSVSALQSVDTPEPIVVADSASWAQSWTKAGFRSRQPSVDFHSEIAILWGFPRSTSCGGNRSGVDSVLLDRDTVRMFAWFSHTGPCLDTVSYSALSVAVRKPESMRRLPSVTVTEHDRTLDP